MSSVVTWLSIIQVIEILCITVDLSLWVVNGVCILVYFVKLCKPCSCSRASTLLDEGLVSPV
jgi:hypothetical protein